jgi:mono/diheme cytochrome c family protein
MPIPLYSLLIAGALPAAMLLSSQAASGEPVSRERQPAALVLVDSGKTIVVANRRSGSLSIIDVAASRTVAEHDVSRGLADLVALKEPGRLLAADQGSNELLLLDCHDLEVQVLDRLKVSPDPVRLAVLGDGASCAVASRRSRRLTFVSIAKGPMGRAAAVAATVGLDLPFCPGELVSSGNGSKLVVADAFGGGLAVIDCQRRAIESVRTIPGHNIGGMAFTPDGKSLVIAHQYLNHLAQTTFDDVHWGLLIRNHLRVVPADKLFAASSAAALLDAGRLFDLGDVGYAAGDPGRVAFSTRGDLIVALAGVDEIAITASPEQGPKRIVVGHGPAALAPSLDGSSVFVANRLDDTISVILIKSGMRTATISLGPRPVLTSAQKGERLFYSAKLSHDGWMSCHSCHTDGHTNNLLSDTLGDGSYGAPKRVPSLLGVAATGPWTWTGSMARLEDQVAKSIETTMHGTKLKDSQITDLKAYLETLSPPPRIMTRLGEADSSEIAAGRVIFQARKCGTCHAAPEYTSPEQYDIGLRDEVGNRAFNPPSLRGLSSRDSFLHDGRSRSLEEVFQKEKHPRGLVLTPKEVTELVAFLKTL